ncbi:uncharacterized protein A1O9_06487 [Exophiala aquamarina CBS 119918]|uniref:Uncharacterized protein n=1 Tax=Exophiala aquamarina CBS 119918 TaxID=1182545 RepID=A0A072PFA4_9EURO|nr:uncharacterized protein A1O9_06487 [Exophiala aquamarina CBS 119918]KEF58561.1 hypothetical protein A1O9_06487 [Exophiala aquamarina CBS 119918]
MTEGLFTSEQGIRGGDLNHGPHPTRTIGLTEFQRRNKYGSYQHLRPVLPRRNAGIYLLPRAPDATVTASVIEVNINDGTTTSKLTEVPAATTGTVVDLSDLGSVTVPGISAATDGSGIITGSQTSITTPPATSLPGSSTTSGLSPAGSVLSDALNGTTTGSDTSSEHTVTVTATSTFEVSLINGTVIVTSSRDTTTTKTGTIRVTASLTSSSAEYTFGQLTETTTSIDDGSIYNAPSTSYFTGVANTGVAGSPTASSPSSATSDSNSGSGGSGPGLTPQQQTVVGGVVGGVAGIALSLVIVLFLLRWYRRRLKSRGELPEQIAARELTDASGPSYPMSQRSSTTPLAAAVVHNLRRLRPHSNQTVDTSITGTTDLSVRDSERGFQRIAGRKIAPVLAGGGDPYGGNYGAFEKETGASPENPQPNQGRGLSSASFYRDSDGFYGGNGAHSPTFPPSPTTATTGARTADLPTIGSASSTRDFAEPSMPMATSTSQISLNSPSRPDGFAVMRPSPARTPVTLSPAASSIRLPIQQPATLADDAPPLPVPLSVPILGMQRDGVGRSLASQDGSRVSKSSGRSAGRFVENM